MTSPGWVLQCDGGSRGNPGPGALGYVLYDMSGAEVEARGEFLGEVTNNVAEYRALLAGLEAAIGRGADPLTVYMDSELVVRQMKGEYRVKHAGLKPLYATGCALVDKLARVTFRSVPRGENQRADALVNETLDDILGSESPR